MNRLNPNRVEDLVFIHINLRLLSRKRNSSTDNEEATKMWDIGRDECDLFDVANILEVASFYHDEPEIEAAFLMMMERKTIFLANLLFNLIF
jgi:hypothetical protein